MRDEINFLRKIWVGEWRGNGGNSSAAAIFCVYVYPSRRRRVTEGFIEAVLPEKISFRRGLHCF